jgi:scyllo-inositol 2-dehydrogenase (NADP+)
VNDERPIRTGIIGFGLSGRIFHAPFIAADPAFALEVVSTSNPARAGEARSLYPGTEIVSSPEELLARGLDLVVLASPPAVHAEQGVAAFESGSAVVVDKPFAASTAEALRLIQASEIAGLPLAVYQNRRFDGDFRTVERLISSGALGTVHRFESTFERWSPALRDRWQDTTPTSEGAGIAYDLGSHLVDQALSLFGPATLVGAELSILREGGVSDDEAFLSLVHGSGVRSHITLSRYAGQNAPRFRVLGSEAAYTVYGLDPQEPTLMAGGTPTDAGFGEAAEKDWGLIGLPGALSPVPTERGEYAAFYRAVASAVRTGSQLPVRPRDALATLEILENAHQIAGF